MAVVNFENGYFVETDSFNHTLKQRYIGTGKEKQPKEMVRTIGYYENMARCAKEYLKCICGDATADFNGTIKEYAEIIDKTAEKAAKSLERVLEGR